MRLYPLVLGLALSSAIGSVTSIASAQPKPDPAKLEKAKEHMTAGSLLYNDPSGPQGAKCEEALVEFSKAYELSGSWKALRATAICELKLERDGAALAHYEEVLKIGGEQIPPEDKTQIENDMRTLKTATAYLKITTNQPNARLVTTRQPSQGLPVTNRYAVTADGITVGVHPGQYTFTATVDGFPDQTWQSEVPNGSHLEHHFDFTQQPDVKAPPPKQETERPVPITVWILTGVTGAAAVTCGTFMGLAKVAKDDYDEQNGAGTTSTAELEEMRDDVITKNVVADVMLGVTAAAFATTLILYFTRPEVAVEGDAQAWTITPRVGPVLSPGSNAFAGVEASASFVTTF
ncbi:MAG: hypothetical protein HOW73_22150 [Polyangiaceae bacterium]|nr:hypothetical protein [Polyangiaceae bacterium]